MISHSQWQQQIKTELTGNILPFWSSYPIDRLNGGFYGALTNDLEILNDVPRTAILCARILWTFSAAYRKLAIPAHLAAAQWAYDYLTTKFWDRSHSGLFWSVDDQGVPVLDRKHHYVQAFGIYGLTEYYRAVREPRSLDLAQELFALLEEHAYDPIYGGYIEGSSRTWEKLEDMRLSNREINCRKSMNTMLHLLEAYTNLLRVWDNPRLKEKHRVLIETFLHQIIDLQTMHFKLFFNDSWQALSPHVSYGHDIEGSWLLVEAAEIQEDPELLAQVRNHAVRMAEAVYQQGRDEDGSLVYEADPGGWVDTNKSWWAQAEAMVGFYNAYQLSGQQHFAQAAWQCWEYIQLNLVDREKGDWIKQRHRDGRIASSVYKVGPWECPYHHSRACFEMLERLSV